MISREQAIATLKRTWRTEELKFYAEFFRPKKDGALIKPRPGVNPFGFFRNLSINDRKIFYPSDEVLKYERNISFKVDVVKGLEDGKYYYLELELEDDENRKENPYALKIKDVFILEEDHLSPKEFINQWFYKKGHTPGDASTIAGQLTLNELELYTHTKRFIFELIQNADDMPDGNKDVNIEINLLPNHLLFLHNGKYFDREDVKAISDAAKSTKSKSLSQTGYKGIGFKSVFTDSTRVYIKSRDYFFKFDKLEPIYRDFYRLYKGYSDNLTPKARKEFEFEYKGREKEYTVIEKIPWQIKPIWVEPVTIPQELSSSPFSKNWQVSIALEISENILRQKNYDGMILGLLKEPRFLLFLRHTKGFKYRNISDQSNHSIVDVSVREKNDILGVYNGETLIASYIKRAFTISITNEDFLKAGLNFQKREIEGGKIEFFDNDGNKLDNIPEKLGRLDKTIITLSAKIERYAIEKLDKENSILFNYLPTSDQRFGFPFLVNADFVSKTDREFIQIENKWNHYLFYHLGQKCIEWIAILANVTHEIQGKKLFSYAKTYLNLLPDELLDEDNEELNSINIAYNKGLTDAIQASSFVIDNNGNTKKCDEIILDDTLISRVLGNGFFKEFTKTKKELPFFMLDVKSLKKDYLNIEKYDAATLIAEFASDPNKLLLTKTLTRLKPEKYFDFLAWLDSFCNINDVDNDWLLDLPIIRINGSVISLRESLVKSDFYYRVTRTKELEPVLNKIGFTLSELNIDDDNFKHLRAVILQQESYLKTDLKLYEHIAAAKDLSKLTATEKNTLITFFESLDEVGKAKYAKSLALFKAKKVGGSLKPLNSLISNNCISIPAWLNDFVIDADEEKALSTTFQGQLLKEKDLLEKLFCNTAAFNEVITNINSGNIEEFYTYLLKLLNNKPEETKIDFSLIPWVFIEASSKFVLASTVYWPESITKLTPVKYASVKTVIEAITDEQLPHFAALQIKKTLALGGKALILSSISPKENEFDVLALNAFLDWLEVDGEKDFLSHFSISMQNDTYSIIPANGSLQYYTTDAELHSYIQNTEYRFSLNPFPKDIYTENRYKIGLLEGDILLEHLIRADCSVSLARFVNDSQSIDLKIFFIYCLKNIELSSHQTYTKSSNEHIVIKLILEYGKEEDIIFDDLISRIYIDGNGLHATNISDKVVFKFKPTEFQQEKRYELKLSGILPSYKDQTYALSIVANNFIDIENKALLERKVFRTQNKKITDIFNEIHSASPEYFSPLQMFFLLLYERDRSGEKKLDVRKGIPDFDDYWFSKDKEKYHLLSTEMLDILFQQNYHEFSSHFIFSDFDPANKIFDDYYALETEVIPHWIRQWIESGESANKKAFLKLCGVNDTDSPVFLLRKSLIEKNKNDFDWGLASIVNVDLLQQTASWLKNQQDTHGLILTKEFLHLNQFCITLSNSHGLILTKEFLHPLYAKMLERAIPFDKLPIPVLVKYGDDNYKLVDNNGENAFHIEGVHWGEYHEKIFNHIIESGYVVDDALPLKYLNALNPIKKPVVVDGDLELLQNNSSIFSEEYFLNWSSKETYPIQVYHGDLIPYTIKYNNVIIDKIQKDSAIKLADVYYVVETEKSDIPYPLKGLLPKQTYDNLLISKVDFARKLKLEQRHVTFTDEEQIALKNLFEDEIPAEFYKDLNLASCVSGLVVLSKQGFDVKNANVNLSKSHLFAQISPVYKDTQDTPRTVMCRSARKGILYITKKAWDRLDQNDISLFVKFGENEKDYYFFEDKTSLLNISDTKYQVFRVEADSEPENTDAILSGKFNPEKIWLILKIKENDSYKSIFEGGIRLNEDNPDWDNVNASEDSIY